MGALQVDPQALSVAGQQVQQAALQIDALRVDLWVRALSVAEAAGDPSAGAAAQNFATAADQFLGAARDELARLYEYLLAVTSAAVNADRPGTGSP